MCRDPKDNFLLDLIDVSMADYLVTGDKELSENKHYIFHYYVVQNFLKAS
jgi:predicted nucleic acid-binding protein